MPLELVQAKDVLHRVFKWAFVTNASDSAGALAHVFVLKKARLALELVQHASVFPPGAGPRRCG